MKILLISMPDAIPLFYSYKSYVPNLGIRSLAANVDVKGTNIKCIDLVFFYKDIYKTLTRAIYDFRPDLVGISAMTFQYDTALKVAGIVKKMDSRIKVALGGYHATLMYDELSHNSQVPFDYMIRNEGEETFNGLVKALAGSSSDLTHIKGLSFKREKEFIHNERNRLLNLDELKPPRRDLQLLDLPRQTFGKVEAVETSRGCTVGCWFCSIDHMYGKNFRKYRVERVINDIKASKRLGANRILFVDDNMTLDNRHLECICEAIVESGLNDLYYGAQLSSRGIASSERLVKKMRQANFAVVFLGIENIAGDKLKNLGKGDIFDDSIRAINYLHKYDIGVMGGFIMGNPDDDLEDIKACFRFARKAKVDILMAQYLTPYPKTVIRYKLLAMGLVEHADDYSRYNGFQPVAKTRYLSIKELEKNIVRLNILWYLGEVFNPRNWFVKSKRVLRHVYIRVVIMTFAMLIDFARGRYGKSSHVIYLNKGAIC